MKKIEKKEKETTFIKQFDCVPCYIPIGADLSKVKSGYGKPVNNTQSTKGE